MNFRWRSLSLVFIANLFQTIYIADCFSPPASTMRRAILYGSRYRQSHSNIPLFHSSNAILKKSFDVNSPISSQNTQVAHHNRHGHRHLSHKDSCSGDLETVQAKSVSTSSKPFFEREQEKDMQQNLDVKIKNEISSLSLEEREACIQSALAIATTNNSLSKQTTTTSNMTASTQAMSNYDNDSNPIIKQSVSISENII